MVTSVIWAPTLGVNAFPSIPSPSRPCTKGVIQRADHEDGALGNITQTLWFPQREASPGVACVGLPSAVTPLRNMHPMYPPQKRAGRWERKLVVLVRDVALKKTSQCVEASLVSGPAGVRHVPRVRRVLGQGAGCRGALGQCECPEQHKCIPNGFTFAAHGCGSSLTSRFLSYVTRWLALCKRCCFWCLKWFERFCAVLPRTWTDKLNHLIKSFVPVMGEQKHMDCYSPNLSM